MEKHTAQSLPIPGLLGVAFIVLKLCHVIGWPWLWVLSPFWMPAMIALLILLIVGVVLIVKAAARQT